MCPDLPLPRQPRPPAFPSGPVSPVQAFLGQWLEGVLRLVICTLPAQPSSHTFPLA